MNTYPNSTVSNILKTNSPAFPAVQSGQIQGAAQPTGVSYADTLRSLNLQPGGFTPMTQTSTNQTQPRQTVVTNTKVGVTPAPQTTKPITTQTPNTQVAGTQTTAPVLGSMQYDLANGLPPGTSSQVGYKAPVTEQKTSATTGVNAILGKTAKPGTGDPVADKAAADKAQADTLAAQERAYAPQIEAINQAMTNELSANSSEKEYRNQAFLQNLAVRGILNTSSEDPVLRQRFAKGEQDIESAIRDKYTLQIMAIKGKIGDQAYQAGIKKADEIIASRKAEWENYYKELDAQNDIYKLLSDEQIATKNLDLEREKMEIDKKYKEGSLTIDQYNSETNRIKAESDRLVNAAQVRKLDADTAKTTSETVAPGATNGKVGEQITFLQDVAKKADALSGASGAGSIQRTVSNLVSGSNQPNQLSQYVDTLKVNLLALATDPTIKKFFGPQMSNADVALMTSAGTTLNAEKNTPEQMKSEIARITDLLGRMQSSVNGGTAAPKVSTGDTVTIQKPDGTTGTIPKANLDAALKLGAKQI